MALGFVYLVFLPSIVTTPLAGLAAQRLGTKPTCWGALALAAAGFAGWIALKMGHVPALQFVAGYAIETSLSVDNLFVFLVIFNYFAVPDELQHRVLFWGILGALIGLVAALKK